MIKKILVAIDGSSQANRALDYALNFAEILSRSHVARCCSTCFLT